MGNIIKLTEGEFIIDEIRNYRTTEKNNYE